jgi:WD40 repeat protein
MISSNYLKNTKISTQIEHPGASDLAAYGDKLLIPDYNGYVTLYNNKSKKLDRWKTAKLVGNSCRQAQWLNDSKFIAITSDDLICKFDVESPIKIGTASNEYTTELTNLCPINENLILTGNDKGHVAFWDLRKSFKKPVSYDDKTHDDCITDISVEGNDKFAHCTSGDGTMSTFNLKKLGKLHVRSEPEIECDFLSVCSIDDAQKVVVGTQEGEVLVYNYKEYGCSSDRIPGHVGTIDTICAYEGNVVLTGSEDGVIRALHVNPSRYLGVVGKHTEDVLRIVLTGGEDEDQCASLDVNGVVKFWDLSCLQDIEVDPTEKVVGKLKQTASVKNAEKVHFMQELDETNNEESVKVPDDVELSDDSEWEDTDQESDDDVQYEINDAPIE